MANLEELIAAKEQSDRQWKLERQAERENAVALQDAAITEITSNPDAYGRYLNMQGDNPGYSPGNIAMVMFQQPEFTKFCTAERWRNLGRSVMESQKDNGERQSDFAGCFDFIKHAGNEFHHETHFPQEVIYQALRSSSVDGRVYRLAALIQVFRRYIHIIIPNNCAAIRFGFHKKFQISKR